VNSDIPYRYIITAVITVMVLTPLLVLQVSRRWYQKQIVNDQTDDVVFLGKNFPSPVLTGLVRLGRYMTIWFANLVLLIRHLFTRIAALPQLSFTFPRNPAIILDKASLMPTLGEVSLIAVFTVVFCVNCLNFSPGSILIGTEYGNLVQSHFIWNTFHECGTCAFWNGYINGGAPAFVETRGAVLHPLVVITTLLAGVTNGSKLMLVFSLLMAGIAQWWLARVMGVGRFARLWAGCIAVVGGHLSMKMESGNIILILSTASAILLLAPLLDLAISRRRSSLIMSGIMLSLFILSGQGYIQIGFAAAILPVFLIFLFDEKLQIKPLWKDFLMVLLLGVLLAGVFLVPFLHFFPNMTKDADKLFTNYQPLEYLPLNLVVHDVDFFKITLLGHDLNVYANYIYIGWVPVILAIFSLAFFAQGRRRIITFLWISLLLIFTICSHEFASWIFQYMPLISSVRWGSIISGLSVPFITALAALSLDCLIHASWWPEIRLNLTNGSGASLSISLLVVIFPAIFSVYQLFMFHQKWITTTEIQLNEQVLNELTPSSTQWIGPDLADYSWMYSLLERGVKITNVWRAWGWKGSENPKANTIAVFSIENPDRGDVYATYKDIELVRHRNNQYAFISVGNQSNPCKARATGGLITVSCANDQAGILTVQENQWTGWNVSIDGIPAHLLPVNFLQVNAPAGNHTYTFRYEPWDVWVGLGATILGILLAVWLGLRAPKSA